MLSPIIKTVHQSKLLDTKNPATGEGFRLIECASTPLHRRSAAPPFVFRTFSFCFFNTTPEKGKAGAKGQFKKINEESRNGLKIFLLADL
jgi:hypothetical protein